MRKIIGILSIFLAFALMGQAQRIKVACVGNSVTYGYGIENRETNCYPAQLQQMLGDAYEVENFGHSGATLLNKGYRPYTQQEAYQKALRFAGDYVIIHLGLNDTDPRAWPNYRDDFVRDYLSLIESFRKANPRCKVWVCRMTPISHRHPRFKSGTRDWYWMEQALIEEIARIAGATLVDLQEGLYDRPDLLPDALHPNAEGAGILARTVYGALTGDYGGLQLPAIYSDRMVLQRDQPLPISGIANQGEKVTVTLAGQRKETVAGTNGKGSVSHLLAAILRQSGYKVGLYTSPHLVDFRERIRVNGQKIPEEYVIDFVERHRSFFETLDPSFFELTSSMAFDYFRAEKVDYAVIEVGMGGRLDSTNIITPILSIITNISLDHTQFLGDTVEKIAFEKAGIIKKDVPALVGEIDRHSVAQVFADAAVKAGTLVYFAQDEGLLKESYLMDTGEWYLDSAEYGQLFGELGGVVQFRNATTVLGAINLLNTVGVNIPTEAVREGFEHVVELTGLMGRWQVLQENPKVVCDTGHNVGGWQYLNIQLEEELKRHKHLFMIVGMVNDKDIDGVLDLMPEKAFYFFTQASVQRAMPAEDFATKAIFHGLSGTICNSVQEAVEKALARAGQDDIIFIGGSTFVVADALPLFLKRDK